MTIGSGIPTTSDLPPRPLGGVPAEQSAALLRGRRRGQRLKDIARRFSSEQTDAVESMSPAGRAMLIVALLVGLVLMLAPFVYMLSTSLKTNAEAAAGTLNLWPHGGPQWNNYRLALSPTYMDFWPALANTVVITTVSVVGQVISSSLVGFGFARFRFAGRDGLFILMLSTMMLPAQVTMIPVFVLFRGLGMIDTFWPLIIPAWLASPFFVFMFRQFFAQVPEELIEAARVDGASSWRIYWQLLLPLCGPVIAIVAIYTFLGTWNDYLGPLIYLNSPANRTLALALDAFHGQYGVKTANLLMAGSMVTMLPCVILFFAAQRYFVQSVASTGLK